MSASLRTTLVAIAVVAVAGSAGFLLSRQMHPAQALVPTPATGSTASVPASGPASGPAQSGAAAPQAAARVIPQRIPPVTLKSLDGKPAIEV